MNQIALRTSLYKSKKAQNEFVLPYIWEPVPYQKPLERREKPRIGFCGQKNRYRDNTLTYIHDDVRLDDRFIIRDQFWGGKPNDVDLNKDFVDNIHETHFTIANRGAGNYSMRFYQALSAGRIPALVVDDMELPFEEMIDWNQYIVTVKTEEELANNIHRVYSERDIEQMQQACYQLYQDYFTPGSFAVKLLEFLDGKYSDRKTESLIGKIMRNYFGG